MNFRKLRNIFFTLFSIGFLGATTSVIIGTIRNEMQVDLYTILLLAFLFGFMIVPGLAFIIIRFAILKWEDNLIIKDFGTPKSRTKTYFIYSHRWINVPNIYPKLKHVTNIKFSPNGLYCNTRKLLFLWKNVEKAIISDLIVIYATAVNGTEIQFALPKQTNFLCLVKTYLPDKINENIK